MGPFTSVAETLGVDGPGLKPGLGSNRSLERLGDAAPFKARRVSAEPGLRAGLTLNGAGD